ncbi:hypothetical protein LOTGIDRAFT_129214 [Lottia gigantea]|uniref:DUF229 domain-containing protein n=1 Tax=Lottia gigantea TaxID=225164 RepID=V3ZQ17_LOTGI|nr:hypothetical protein LOTGIDRAFT_129214 [Lottia gigantea]ESO86427.1 hypothetical protein LOTGIDRAFT_129214 [Lottia gigantea]
MSNYNVCPGYIYRTKRRKALWLCFICSLILLFINLIPRDTNHHSKDSEVDPGFIARFKESLEKQSGQTCVHPQLDPFHQSVMNFYRTVPKVTCSPEENWVYVVNGTFRISRRAVRKYGKITCEYAPVVRGTSDYTARHMEHIKPMPDGSALVMDFFKVACVSINAKRYFNIHAGISFNKTVHERHSKVKLPKNALGLDVLMFGFDSVSRMSWIRQLPKTRNYFLNTLKGIELEGYNIVGDGTPQALLPILTGKTEEELPEARRGHDGAQPVDGHPWIWKDFKKAGYVTAWAEDMASIGTFQYRMIGFKETPTDHNMRPFYLSAERMYGRNRPYCLGSVPRHKTFINWLGDVFNMYGSKSKFVFGFHGETSHNDNNQVQIVDEDAMEFLKSLEDRNLLNRTILILMSDHGARFADIRQTAQGKEEERMPYFAYRFPPWFEKQYPEIIQNFRKNSRRLTTPFDVHETFHDILNYSSAKLGDSKRRGISLFREIPKERSCADAGIQPHWCACLQWLEVDQSDPVIKQAVTTAIETINSYTEPHRLQCSKLKLFRVTRSVKYATNSNILKFKSSSDHDGRVADLSGNTQDDEDYYQITFITSPGNGQYEMTVRHCLNSSQIVVSEKEISRINRYGSDPACIQDEFPHLRPYCYCIKT